MHKINWKALFTSLVFSLGTGGLAAFITAGSMNQYERMYQPQLAPPGWLFPVVWTILYILMGIAAYLIYESEAKNAAQESEKQAALEIYAVQLVVNFIWPILFFNLNAYLLSFAWLLLLWYLILQTIRKFYAIDKTAGILLIPYLLWVTFAGYLNLAIALYT